MKLSVDFSLLDEAIKTMGAARVDITFDDDITPIEEIDKQLDQGIEVNFQDINFDTGLASYQGRQVLLYIKDHSYNNKIYDVLKDGSKGNRFHVADCKTLQKMRKAGRFDRYVVTNRIDGVFYVSGTDKHTHQLVEGEAHLSVCQFCLEAINYKKFASLPLGAPRKAIVSAFNLADFFDTYSSFFTHMPLAFTEKASSDYSADWPEISRSVREQYGYICQECGVDLKSYKRLMHVHHINGRKLDNRSENLRALCCDCHRKQPNHSHMFIPHRDTKLIHNLRLEQGLMKYNSPADVYKLADPGMYGVLDTLERYRILLPEVGTLVYDSNGKVVTTLDLAWPHKKIGITVSKDDAVAAHALGWKVYSMRLALIEIDDLAYRI